MHTDEAHGGAVGKPLLRLTFFGQMRAEDADGRNVLPRSRKTRAVLAVLALAAPKPVPRTRLTGLLWSRRGREQAHASLRQSVHELQRALGPHARDLLRADRRHLALDDGRLWADVRVLGAATASDAALDLFQPMFLDDLGGLDPAFEAWLASESRNAGRNARSLAEHLLINAGGAQPRVVAAGRLLSIERAHEGAWRALIAAHLELGDRAAARLAFDQCKAALADGHVTPAPETERLLHEVWQPARSAVANATRREPPRAPRLVVPPPQALDGGDADTVLPGLAEEIIAAVSGFRWISCLLPTGGLAKSDAEAWQSVDTDYVLETALQGTGDRIRIILRLIDIRGGARVIWVRRQDRLVADVLEMQAEIASETAAQIDPVLLLSEGDRLNTADMHEPTAYELTLRAIPGIYRLERTAFESAGNMLRTAAELEPRHAAAHAWLAYWHLFLIGQAWAEDPDAAARRAGELAEQAVTLDPGDARALALVGHVRAFGHKQVEQACALHEKALSLNPNLPLAWCCFGLANSYAGRQDTAIQQIKRAQQLSPDDPHAFFFDMALMMPYFLRRDFETACSLGRRALELNPAFSSSYKGYLATLGHLGQDQEAARVRGRLLRLEPGFSVASAVARSPLARQEDLLLYADGLRRAGLREN